MLESKYQADLIKRIRARYPGCIILKNDPGYLQGILDLTLLWERNWALLEVKASPNARLRPNQRYYVDRANEMSFGAFINPENEMEVLDALQQSFEFGRNPRVS